MRPAIVVLAVLAVAYAIYALAAGAGALRFQGFDAPTRATAQHWQPPEFLADASDVALVFAPKADFPAANVTVAPGLAQALDVSETSKTRVAQIQIVGQGALGATYQCSKPGDDPSCPMTLCVCAQGSTITPPLGSQCPSSFQESLVGGVCPKGRDHGTLAIYPDARTVRFFTLTQQSATAKLN